MSSASSRAARRQAPPASAEGAGDGAMRAGSTRATPPPRSRRARRSRSAPRTARPFRAARTRSRYVVSNAASQELRLPRRATGRTAPSSSRRRRGTRRARGSRRAIASGARLAPDDELRDHRVVEDGISKPAATPRSSRTPGPPGTDNARTRPGDGRNPTIRILGVDAALDRVRARRQRASRLDRQPLAQRDANLPLHEIDARHHLGDRMLDLQPRVHFEEVELAVSRRAGTRSCRRSCSRPRGRRARRTRPCARRVSASSTSDGDSSTTFWWRR